MAGRNVIGQARMRLLERLINDGGSAVMGWVMTAPLVLAVAVGGAGATSTASASLRAHAAAVRMAYAAAVATSPAERTAAIRSFAAGACAAPAALWSERTVEGVDMVVVHLACTVPAGVLGRRTVTSSAHAPIERP